MPTSEPEGRTELCPHWSIRRANRTFDPGSQRLLKRAPGLLDKHSRTGEARFFRPASVDSGRKCVQALVAIRPALESGRNLPRALPGAALLQRKRLRRPGGDRRIFFRGDRCTDFSHLPLQPGSSRRPTLRSGTGRSATSGRASYTITIATPITLATSTASACASIGKRGLKRSAASKERRDEHAFEDERGFRCLEPVRGVGTEWIGQEGALKAARKDWMERVRYDHGERFIDMTNDREEVTRCSRVSIGEVAGQVMYRCEIMARPCQAHMEEAHVEGSPQAQQEEERCNLGRCS